MLRQLGVPELAAMLRAAGAELVANEATLGELDSISGDGDHGASMGKAGRLICGFQSQPNDTPETLFAKAGEAFMSIDGGASGSLLGMFFAGIALGCRSKTSLNGQDLATAFEQGLTSMRRYTKAKVGDKTMLDALEPAVQALTAAGTDSVDFEGALSLAAEAAWGGAVNTKKMQAKLGRAQHLGARTMGWQDPGATTIALLFRGFANANQN